MSNTTHHSLDNTDALIKFLAPRMPTCIALYRRLQFGNFTPSSHILSSLSPEDLASTKELCKPWIVAFVDRTSRPETEVWITASWETSPPTPNPEIPSHAAPLVTSLVQEIKSLGLVTQETTTTETTKSEKAVVGNGTKGVERSHYEAYLNNKNIILFGSVHETTIGILKDLGFIAPGLVGVDIPYRKYIFDLNKPVATKDLPEDLEWGTVQQKDFALVRSRTQIPRQDRTLARLPSVAIYPVGSSTPIAWAFLGYDASLTTLHVEEAYRGRGLAKALSGKLFVEGMEGCFEEVSEVPGRFGHADVAVENEASKGVCGSLGGVWGFMVYWVRVDLGVV